MDTIKASPTRNEQIANLRDAIDQLEAELPRCGTAEARDAVQNEIRATRQHMIRLARGREVSRG